MSQDNHPTHVEAFILFLVSIALICLASSLIKRDVEALEARIHRLESRIHHLEASVIRHQAIHP